MAFQSRITQIVCSHCDAQHTVRWHRLPCRAPYRLTCKRCGETLAEGKSVADYDEPRLT